MSKINLSFKKNKLNKFTRDGLFVSGFINDSNQLFWTKFPKQRAMHNAVRIMSRSLNLNGL